MGDEFESISYKMGQGSLKVSRKSSLVQIPDCGHAYEITSDDQVGLKFEFNDNELTWTIDLDDNSLAGNHQIGALLTIENEFQSFTQPFPSLWELNLLGDVTLKFPNNPPSFNKIIPEVETIRVGEVYNFDTGSPSEDTVSTEVDVSSELILLSINEDLGVSVEFIPQKAGVSEFSITLTDNGSDNRYKINANEVKLMTYVTKIVVLDPLPEELILQEDAY